MLYLFSFKEIASPILLSKERGIYLKNIDSDNEKDYFNYQFFIYEVNKAFPIMKNYFRENNSIENIIKIDTWIDFDKYLELRFSMDPKDREKSEVATELMIENHNIFNVFLFALSVTRDNRDLIDNNIHLQSLDSNKLSILKTKILTMEFVKYLDFNVIEKDLIELFWFFDLKYKEYNLDNFIYIGELLDLYNSSKSEYFKFTQLVAIIEFLLIKWDKEITKQFKLKCGVIIERLITKNNILDKKHLNLILFDRKTTIKELDLIYDIRSHIVHWNIKGINTKIEIFKKNCDDSELVNPMNFKYFYMILQSVASWLLYSYIQEPEYIDFLKNN